MNAGAEDSHIDHVANPCIPIEVPLEVHQGLARKEAVDTFLVDNHRGNHLQEGRHPWARRLCAALSIDQVVALKT